MLTPEISQTDRQGRSIFSAAPWPIPRIHHGFYEAAHGILIADLNREPQSSLDAITGNVTTLATRPLRSIKQI